MNKIQFISKQIVLFENICRNTSYHSFNCAHCIAQYIKQKQKSIAHITMSRSILNKKKIAVLDVVKANKDVLFAVFNNNTVTKNDKATAWSKVLRAAKNLKIAGETKSWQFARDSLFGVWKSRTLVNNYNIYLNIKILTIFLHKRPSVIMPKETLQKADTTRCSCWTKSTNTYWTF